MVPDVELMSELTKPPLRNSSERPCIGLPGVKRPMVKKSYKKPWYLTPNKWKEVQSKDKELKAKQMSTYRASNTYLFLRAESEGRQQEKYSSLGHKLSTMETVGKFKEFLESSNTRLPTWLKHLE
jgi:hypothetical protein